MFNTKKLHIIVIVLKYGKSFLMILLHILWVVRHHRGCYLELYGIDEEWRCFSPWINEWLEQSMIHTGRGQKSADIRCGWIIYDSMT